MRSRTGTLLPAAGPRRTSFSRSFSAPVPRPNRSAGAPDAERLGHSFAAARQGRRETGEGGGRTPSTAVLQAKTFTDHEELVAYQAILERAESTATDPPGHNVLASVDVITDNILGDVNATLDVIRSANAQLRDGAELWETEYWSRWRGPHNNDRDWLADHTADVVTADPARLAYVAENRGSRYVEWTVDSDWRLVWDMITQNVFLTLHYDDDGTHSPFFLIQGLGPL